VHRDRVVRSRRRTDWAAEEDVAGEDEVGRKPLANGRSIGVDPRVELASGEVLHALDPVAVVAVEDEHRQQAAHVRAHGVRTSEVEALGVGLL
jgi:hypothetical protein